MPDFEKLKFTDKDFTVEEQSDGTIVIAFRHKNKLYIGEVIAASSSIAPGGGPGSSAPLNGQYIMVGNDASLPSERALVGNQGVKLIDAGANSSITASADIINLTEKVVPVTGDFVMIYDATGLNNKRVNFNNFSGSEFWQDPVIDKDLITPPI